MSVLAQGELRRGVTFASQEIIPLEKRLNELENNQKKFFSELKEYLIGLENMARYIATHPYMPGQYSNKLYPQESSQSLEQKFTLRASNLFNSNPKTDVKKPEEPTQITLEQRISDLESEVTFLKGLPPALMESLGYKKV